MSDDSVFVITTIAICAISTSTRHGSRDGWTASGVRGRYHLVVRHNSATAPYWPALAGAEFDSFRAAQNIANAIRVAIVGCIV